MYASSGQNDLKYRKYPLEKDILYDIIDFVKICDQKKKSGFYGEITMNLADYNTLQKILKSEGFNTKKSLGQNFFDTK